MKKSDLILFTAACAMAGYFVCQTGVAHPVEAAAQSEFSLDVFTAPQEADVVTPAPVQLVSAPQTKVVWSRSCQGGSCQLVPRRVAVTASVSPGGSCVNGSCGVRQQRTGVFNASSRGRSFTPVRKLFSRRPVRRLFGRCGR